MLRTRIRRNRKRTRKTAFVLLESNEGGKDHSGEVAVSWFDILFCLELQVSFQKLILYLIKSEYENKLPFNFLRHVLI